MPAPRTPWGFTMSNPDVPQHSELARRDKRRVALVSFMAAAGLVTVKLVVGLATNSLGILSEAAHSGLDLVATGMTLWAVHIASQPADFNHTYGHGKFENLSALAQTLLLLATCGWIAYEAVYRLVWAEHEIAVQANAWAFGVVLGSIAVDAWRSRALRRAASEYQSQALEADALHFATDIWSSAVVLVGLLGVALSQRLKMPGLALADAVAALGVAAIVAGVSIRLLWQSLADLVDAVPAALRARVAEAAQGVPGVAEVRRVRLRRSGAESFADVTLSVDRGTALERSHSIADQVEAAVRSVLPRADVVVHIEPAAQADEDVLTTVRVVAARHGLGAHAVRVYDDPPRRSMELHLEVSESLSLEEAHQQATRFEEDLRQALPGLARITTHLEPIGGQSTTQPACVAGQAEVLRALDEFARTTPMPLHPHDLDVQQAGGELAVWLHCALDRATAITDAHEITQRLEGFLRGRVPGLGRVVIHVEPPDPAPDAG